MHGRGRLANGRRRERAGDGRGLFRDDGAPVEAALQGDGLRERHRGLGLFRTERHVAREGERSVGRDWYGRRQLDLNRRDDGQFIGIERNERRRRSADLSGTLQSAQDPGPVANHLELE